MFKRLGILSFLFIVLCNRVLGSESVNRKNIILIITDDQDIELGSMDFMPKTSKLMREKGAYFSSGFVTTPICCPSRTSILSGLYVHNHNVHTNNLNCSGTEWRKTHEPRALPVPIHNAGYRTAYLGKYLNEYEGGYIPPGWDYWLGLVKNSKFYNYSVNLNGEKVKFGSEYAKDYFSDVITNHSLSFLSDHLRLRAWQPFLTVLSYPAPHGPEDPAPQHAHLFQGEHSHRTDSWNYAPNPDKQWLLQRTGKMEAVHVAFTDMLHRRRLQTLQSVDEGVHRIFSLLRDFNQLSNTYVLYTSDHGYHLGQFGLIKGKNMPYEFDIRVPFFLRGPGVPRNVTLREPVSNIDILPTFLDIAGVPIPDHVDGRSLLELLKLKKGRSYRNTPASSTSQLDSPAPWRDTVLIERGKMPKLKKIRDRFLNQKALYSKEMRLNAECAREEWQRECGRGQMWRCYRSRDGRWRIFKCREGRTRGGDCACPKRDRRNTREDDDSDIESFLLHVHSERVRHSQSWFQGVFPQQTQGKIRLPRSPGSLCQCTPGNSTHPLKNMDVPPPVTDEILYDFGFSSGTQPRRKFLNSSPLNSSALHSPSNSCNLPQMNCFSHSDTHWRTPPLWPTDYGQFCFCQNSNNNTYWCLRTVNSTSNTLYCEFVTEFISYYDLDTDPYQLTNMAYSLELSVLEELSERLQLMRSCRGRTCNEYSVANWREQWEKNKEKLR